MSEKIVAALGQLDKENPNHWTAEGLPRLDTVKLLAGDQSLTRDAINAAAPGFSRAGTVPSDAAPVAPVTPAAPVEGAAGTDTQPSTQDADKADVVTAPAPPPAPVEALKASEQKPFSPEDLAAAKEDLEGVEVEIAEIDKWLAKATAERAALRLKKDDLVIRIDKMQPRDSLANEVQQYHASQLKLLDQRASQIGKARAFQAETGVRLQDLVPKRSPLDQSLARQTGHGQGRKV